MVSSIQNALMKNGIALNVSLYRMYSEGRSAGFELKDVQTDEIIFTMDMDVNRPAVTTKIYEVEGLQFCGVVPTQMVEDKISAVSSEKVFRRIKDVVDLYYLSKVFVFDKAAVLQTLENNGRALGSFDGFLNRADDLKHAYEKFRFTGDVDKPQFDEVYSSVKQFIQEILP